MDKEEKKTGRKHFQVVQNYDLVVTGGGLSGVCTAITAARGGAKVALVQDRPVLGGNASSEVRVWALGATSHMGNNNRWAREGGLIDEIAVENLHRNKEGNPVIFDALLLDKVLAEPNLTLLLNTVVYEVKKDSNGHRIKAVHAFNPQNGINYKLTATLFCDASGDGIVAYLAGASYRMGAEESHEYNEGFSPSKKYGKLMGHTIFLYSKKTDKPVKFVAPEFALKDMKKIPKLNQVNPGQNGINYWWFEYGGTMDTIKDSEEIKMELWKVVYGAWNHIKNSGLYPEAENMTLEWVGNVVGKRESRRFEGHYMLTQHDIVEQRQHPDDVAFGGWAIDLHPAEGVYAKGPSCNQYHAKGIYGIPYRCYVSRDIENLFIAGRLISATHVAFGSTRVMLTGALGGQAIGTAAAKCVHEGLMPADLIEEQRMKQLQQQLNYDGQSIPHLPLDTSRNLLRTASIRATSTCTVGSLPENGEWVQLNYTRGMLLPLEPDTCYEIELKLRATVDTVVRAELLCASKPFNYTPDMLIEQIDKDIPKGTRRVKFKFKKGVPQRQYAFLVLRSNPDIDVALSEKRLSGIVSVDTRGNEAVNNRWIQQAPKGSGFEDFEFMTPERRPLGKNLALTITPALNCYHTENLLNGYVRPYLSTNAWAADISHEQATLTFQWEKLQEIHSVRLFFDTDADHPMETIQWGHPESHIPFCVRKFVLTDDEGRVVAGSNDNYTTIRTFHFSEPVHTTALNLFMVKAQPNIPISLFEVEIR